MYTTIAKVEWPSKKHEDGQVTTWPVLTLACGHQAMPASHFSYHVGAHYRCFRCNQKAPNS